MICLNQLSNIFLGIRPSVSNEPSPNIYNFFQFLIYAEDGGTPAGRSQNIPVTITVQRNLQTPVFNNLPNSIRIQPTQSGTFFTANATDDDTVVSINKAM